MQAAWTTRPTQTSMTPAVGETTEADQAQYQIDVFRSIQKGVLVACFGLSLVYLIPFIQQGSWPSLVISLTFLSTAVYSTLAYFRIKKDDFNTWSRLWLVFATVTVFIFGFFQSAEFINIAALGAGVVIMLAIFLEPGGISIRWAWLNISLYILVAIAQVTVDIPPVDIGVLRPIVLYITPIIVLYIMAAMGRVTTQYFKSNLLQSEAQRKQLETQGQLLVGYAHRADEARVKAERSDKVKSAFLASMSHELRTPLNAVINFTQFVVDGDTGPINQDQRDLLNDVVNSAKHLLYLINDVLDMSKIEAGSLTLFVEDNVNLNKIVENVVSTGHGLINGQPISLDCVVDTDLPHIRGDRQRILQILLNIMSNACKFTFEGKITISACQQADNILISINDTGPGIAADDQDKIFEAFRQTGTGIRHGGGTGLGMAISKSLTEAHGGQLTFQSELGQGTTFYVSLPIKSENLIPELI